VQDDHAVITPHGTLVTTVACTVITPHGTVITTDSHLAITPSGRATLICRGTVANPPEAALHLPDVPCRLGPGGPGRGDLTVSPSGNAVLVGHVDPRNN
jgi:hypothetical protein